MHNVLIPRDDVDRLYVSRKEGRRGLAIIEGSINALIQRLGDYLEGAKEDGLQPPETTLTTRGSTEQK